MPTHPENLLYPSQAKTSASTSTQPPWNPIGDLSAIHVEMIKKSVEGLGPTRIRYHMKRLGHEYSKTHIVRVLQSQKGREFASVYSAMYFGGVTKLVEYGTSLTPEALQTQYDVMRDPLIEPRHRLAAAQDHMDRFGIPKISRQESENKTPTMIVVNLLPSQLSQFAMPQPTIEAEVVMLPEVSSANDE